MSVCVSWHSRVAHSNSCYSSKVPKRRSPAAGSSCRSLHPARTDNVLSHSLDDGGIPISTELGGKSPVRVHLNRRYHPSTTRRSIQYDDMAVPSHTRESAGHPRDVSGIRQRLRRSIPRPICGRWRKTRQTRCGRLDHELRISRNGSARVNLCACHVGVRMPTYRV